MNEKVKIHLKEHKKKYIYGGVAFLFVILIFFGYKQGYRLQENFMIGKIGFLSMEVTLPNTNIFIDGSQKIVTTKDNEVLTLPLSPRSHTVIISHDGYFPWKKDFSIPSNSIVNFAPVFVSSNPSGAIITTNDAEYWKIRNQIITDALPTKDSPRISKDGSTKLWIEQNAVMVEISSTTAPTEMPKTKTVIQPEPAIKNLYFYKDRPDVVMFSIDNAVYAIDVDKEGTQNFLPIYKGTSPSFIEATSSFIYVLDGETLMQVVI